MFSLILPPVVILLALGGIMYLYFRKLPEVEVQIHHDSSEPHSLSTTSDRIRRLSLGMVEWFARWSKTLSLRLYKLLHSIALKAHEAKERAAKRVSIGKQSNATSGKHVTSDEAFPRLDQEESVPSATSLDSPISQGNVTSPQSFIHLETPEEDREHIAFPDRVRDSQTREYLGVSRERMIDPTFSQEWPREEVSVIPASGIDSTPARSNGVHRTVKNSAVQHISSRRAVSSRGEMPEASEEMLADATTTPKNQLEEILIERISMNPRDIEAYERLGDYYLEQDNLTDAKECYRQVLKLSPAYRLVKIKIRRLERLLEKR